MQRIQRVGRLGLLAIWLLSAACLALAEPTTMPATRPVEVLRPADFQARRLLVVHYHRPDGEYDGWNLWVWPEGGDGAAYPFEVVGDRGRAVVPIQNGEADRFGFIVRRGDWEQKDVGTDRFVNLEDDVTQIYLAAGDPAVYDNSLDATVTPKPTSALLDGAALITLACTAPLSDLALASLTVTAGGESVRVTRLVKAAEQDTSGMIYSISLDRDLATDVLSKVEIDIAGFDTMVARPRSVLDDERFYAGDVKLGPTATGAQTTFRTWSPLAEKVEVLLLASTSRERANRIVGMKPAGRGVWEATVPGFLHGQAYRMRFTHPNQAPQVAPDIHGFAASADSETSVVVDFSRVMPKMVAPPVSKGVTDEVIYELHVRDFSIADPTLAENQRGTYLGLIHRNPAEGDAPSTGMDHLLDLGVTAVHLLPIHDFNNERHDYNWGYWTALFNVPEADYASDPSDPLSAIRDLKTTINGLHENDLRVILDVVYNHTATGRTQAAYDATVPGYFYRTSPSGQLRNDPGTGNSIADERPMVRKFIVDSLVFWASEYKVDGFRFDPLGTHRPDTVEAIVKALGNVRDDLTIYGEPWTGGGPLYFGKGEQRGRGLAVFNDHLRNAVRGGLDDASQGFASGPGGSANDVLNGVRGAIDDFTASPAETINYVSAHDNLTLWDKLTLANPSASETDKIAMQKLALGVVLTSQGAAFIHGGSDFARTKGGEHNSYNKGDAVNAFDWDRKAQFSELNAYVAGLIELRRSHPAFRMTSADQVRENLHVIASEPMIVYRLNGNAVGDDWDTVLVAYNGTDRTLKTLLPEGEWKQVVDEALAGVETIRTASDSLTLPPYSMAVLRQ